MEENLKTKLTEYTGNEFFKVVESCLQVKISETIKNILIFNKYDCAFTFSKFDASAIDEIQNCMRDTFDKDFLEGNESVTDYLGKFAKKQKKFILFSGEIRLLHSIAEMCQQLYKGQPVVDNSSSLNSCQSNESGIL